MAENGKQRGHTKLFMSLLSHLTSCYYFLLWKVCNINQLPRVSETEGTLQVYSSSEKCFNMLEM